MEVLFILFATSFVFHSVLEVTESNSALLFLEAGTSTVTPQEAAGQCFASEKSFVCSWPFPTDCMHALL